MAKRLLMLCLEGVHELYYSVYRNTLYSKYKQRTQMNANNRYNKEDR